MQTWQNKLPVLIAGGGIGGLAMANCLQRVGIPYKIIEASPEFGVAGYGIGLGHNAMNCLGKINPNLQKRIENIGLKSSSTFKTGRGKDIFKVAYLDGKYSKYSPSGFLPMSRVNLQKELLKDIPSSNILLDSRVKSFSQDNNTVIVNLEKGTSINGSVLIGADGIKSSVRKTLHELYPNELGPEPNIIYTNITLLGGETIVKKENNSDLNDFCWLFSGNSIGTILPIRSNGDKQNIFWSLASKGNSPQEGRDISNLKEELLEYSKPFINSSFDFPYLINNSIKQVVWDIYELDRKKECKKWGYKNVTLLGDAAHAVTPWVGQGAGISVEDAFDLTHRLLKYPDNIPKALEIYESTRIPRAHLIKTAARGSIAILNVIDNPFWRPILRLYYKIISIPSIYHALMKPLLGYNKPEESLPEYKKNE